MEKPSYLSLSSLLLSSTCAVCLWGPHFSKHLQIVSGILLTSIYHGIWQPNSLSLAPSFSVWKRKSEVCLTETWWCAVCSETSTSLAVGLWGQDCMLAYIFVHYKWSLWSSYLHECACVFPLKTLRCPSQGSVQMSTCLGRYLLLYTWMHSCPQIYGFWLNGN